MQTKQSVIPLPAWPTFKFLCFITIFLVLMHFFVNVMKYISGSPDFYGLVPLFHLSGENNIPSFFSGCLLLINALLLTVIWRAKQINSEFHRIWAFLAALFLFLAFDEMFQVHERLIVPLRETLGTSGLLYFAWIIVYGVGVLGLAFLFFPVWWRLNKAVRLLFALSAILYLAGAIGCESIGGMRREIVGNNPGDLIWMIVNPIEETLELAGLVTFVYSLLTLIKKDFNGVAIIMGLASGTIPETQPTSDSESVAAPHLSKS